MARGGDRIRADRESSALYDRVADRVPFYTYIAAPQPS
jgi:hypothetical protein